MDSKEQQAQLAALELMEKNQPTVYALGVVLTVLAGIAVILCVPPLIWHARKRNHAVVVLVVWLILLNLMNFINAIIWPNDDLVSRWEGYGLCDVETRLQIGSYVGLPGALAVIMRNLTIILDTKNTSLVPSRAQKTRSLAFLIFYCYAFPIYLMAVEYVVQPNRYIVFAISGCTPSYDRSWLALVLVFIWPVFVSVLDVYYAIYLIVRMHRYRAQFSRLLQNANTTKSRFQRLFIMAVILVAVILPVQIYILYRNVAEGIYPYSWSKTHSKYWDLIYPVPTEGKVLFDRWIRVASAYLMFIFFGLGSDAKTMYKGWLVKIGLGHVFPSLMRPNSTNSRFSWGSIAGKARALIPKSMSGRTSSSESTTIKSPLSPDPLSPTGKSYLSSSTHTDEIFSSSEGKYIDEMMEIKLEKEDV